MSMHCIPPHNVIVQKDQVGAEDMMDIDNRLTLQV